MKRILIGMFTLMLVAASVSCSGTGSPTSIPTEVPPATATDTPPSYPEKIDPAGIALVQSDGTLLAFYDLDGTLLGTRPLQPEQGIIDDLHIYGSSSGGVESIGVMHIKHGNKEVTVTTDDQEIVTIKGVLTGYTGVEGQPVVALATAQDTEPGNLLLEIHLVTPETLPDDDPVLSMEMPYGGAISPVYIQMENGTPTAIWYTKQPYAIGGEIIFQPTHELYFVDINSGETVQYLSTEDVSLPAFSPDGTLLAYVDLSSVHVRNSKNGEEQTFAILPDSGHGAGDMIFSPDGQTIAWKEADGTNLGEMSYYAVVRIASINEGPLHDLYKEYFYPLTASSISDMDTVAWVDGDTLLISITDWNKGDELWVVDIEEPTTRLLGPGEFTGFIYP